MKTAVFVFGRFNPPTIGHEKLLNALTATAQREGGKALVYTSSTQDAKKNPLSKNQIFQYLAKAFPKQRKTFPLFWKCLAQIFKNLILRKWIFL